MIPIEVALKIASKIRANERFCAYIVIPMWPEGVPTSSPTQRILFWQVTTVPYHRAYYLGGTIKKSLLIRCDS